MSGVMKKAGEAAAKAVVSSSAAGAAAGSANAAVATKAAAAGTGIVANVTAGAVTEDTRPLVFPLRSLTAEEAPHYKPYDAPIDETMMPWRGWFQRFVHSVLGDKNFAKFRNIFFYAPDDIYDLQQAPLMSKPVPISKTDPTLTHKYRTPSPGSQIAPRIPEFDHNEDPYDTGYFKKDTLRRYQNSEMLNPEVERMKLELMDPANNEDVAEELAKLERGPLSSPGNKGIFATGPTTFDPTGLRSTMSVTWPALQKSLDEHMPDHLPTPDWEGSEEAILKWHEERDLPPPIGGYYRGLKIPYENRIASW